MTQDELKKAVGWAALQYVQPGTIVGVGTGSTAAHFIDALGTMKGQIEGAVSSSDASTQSQPGCGGPTPAAAACSQYPRVGLQRQE